MGGEVTRRPFSVPANWRGTRSDMQNGLRVPSPPCLVSLEPGFRDLSVTTRQYLATPALQGVNDAAARLLLVAIGYFMCGRLGYLLAVPYGFVTLWPQSGF